MKQKTKKKPAKMGRPPKLARDKQTERVVSRFTLGEYKRLAQDAKAADLPPATFLASLWRKMESTERK